MLPDPLLDEDSTPAGPALAKGLLLAAAAIALVAISLLALKATGDDASERPDGTFTFVIPAGSGVRVDRGEQLLDVFPHVLDLQVGDRLVIVNEDVQDHLIGPFVVRSGETLDYVFSEAGTYRGRCTLHGVDDEAVINVR